MPPQWALELTEGGGLEPSIPPVQARTAVECRVRRGPDACLVSAEVGDAESIDPGAFDEIVGQMIVHAFGLLRQTAAPHAVRIWNFIPAIYDVMAPGLDRYRAFNLARHRSFCRLFGAAAVDAGTLPTASCVGHAGKGLAIHVLGATNPGTPIENPRQIPAFAYSPRYGPRPPCFARATLAGFAGGPVLLVGGTASVLGEDSAHVGSRSAQLHETLTNLTTLISDARRVAGSTPAATFAGVLAARVYYKHPGDLPWLREHMPPELSVCAEYVRAEICRDELLVEIELIVDPRTG